MQVTSYVRIFADDRGESHFIDVDVSLAPVNFAPPAAPLNVASLFPASGCFLVGGPHDWGGDVPHPSPRRQLICVLQGEFDATASDGETRRFPPGAVLLLEDTTGKGHATRVVGASPFVILGVALAD
jgi:hypothetical protein